MHFLHRLVKALGRARAQSSPRLFSQCPIISSAVNQAQVPGAMAVLIAAPLEGASLAPLLCFSSVNSHQEEEFSGLHSNCGLGRGPPGHPWLCSTQGHPPGALRTLIPRPLAPPCHTVWVPVTVGARDRGCQGPGSPRGEGGWSPSSAPPAPQ